MSRKAKDIFVSLLRWLLKEWVKALLLPSTVLVLGFLGLVFRNYIKDWLIVKHSIKLHGFVWLLLFFIFLFLLAFFGALIFRKIAKVKKFGRKLKTRKDVEIAIRNWISALPLGQTRHYYDDVENELNLKHGVMRAYLEAVAVESVECEVRVEIGKKTFELTKEPPHVV